MINREWKQVTINAYSNEPDTYGQQHKTISSTRTIRMVIKPTSITNVNDPRFIDVTDIGLTDDNSLTAGNEIVDGTNIYLIMHVMPTARLNQALLKLCH